MNKNIDWSISAIRFMSMLFIITSHLMQYYFCELAWWFNVGVQIFLCISGYLYGQRKHIGTKKFLVNGFSKLLIGYYLLIIPVALLHLFYYKIIDFKGFLLIMLMGQKITGAGHLWFVPLILCCYLLTPFLHKYFNDNFIKNKTYKLIGLLFITLVVFKIFIPYFKPAWISCYIIGFYLGNIKLYKKNYYISAVVLVILGVIFNGIQITCKYIYQINVPTMFCDYAHTLLGISLFLIFKQLLFKVKESKLLVFSDTYSYYIYLVHQFFIFRPFTLMKITSNAYINIIVILLCIACSGIALKKISDYVFQFVNKKVALIKNEKEINNECLRV